MEKTIAIYGNAYQDTILTVADFPVENKANQVLSSQQQEGGIHNVYRDLNRLAVNVNTVMIPWKQSAATIIANKKASQRTSLVYELEEVAKPDTTDANWHHVCYLDDLTTIEPQQLLAMKQSGFVSVDFCKQSEKINYLALLQSVDFIFCSTEDCLDAKELLKKLADNTILILHDKSGSRSFKGNNLILQHQVKKVEENLNPLGAGDSFAAAFINSMINNQPFDQAIANAHHYATQRIIEENHE